VIEAYLGKRAAGPANRAAPPASTGRPP